MTKWLQEIWAEDFTITKRLMGIACVIGGLLGTIAIILADVVREESSFGPFQKLALAAMVGIVFIGLTLIPLNDRPA